MYVQAIPSVHRDLIKKHGRQWWCQQMASMSRWNSVFKPLSLNSKFWPYSDIVNQYMSAAI